MPRLAPLAAALALLALGCGDSAQFTTRYATDYVRSPHRLSVLGVYKDGRMNPEVWDQIGPGLATSLGGACSPGYDALVAASNAPLSAAIDDYARANGIGDELLEQLAPAATGDLILVVTVAGRVIANKGQELPDTNTVAGGPPGTMGSKYRGMSTGAGPTRGMRRPALADGTAFEMSASLFSVAQHRSVGLVTMLYTGPSVDDAVARLSARLGKELPGSACGGWNWSVALDDRRIRELAEH